MWNLLIALGFLLSGITLSYQPHGQLILHTNLTLLGQKLSSYVMISLNVEAVIFYILIGLYLGSAVSIIQLHTVLPIITVAMSILIMNNPWLEHSQPTMDLFWKDISLLGGLLLLKSNRRHVNKQA